MTDALPPVLEAARARRDRASELVDALVEIHAVDWEAAGLASFGKPTATSSARSAASAACGR